MRFKQFSVDDSRCAMKVGTDGILLGAWVSCEGAGKLLDIGTGSGLIALMAAQRCAAGGDRRFHITAIDIDADAAGQATENFAASPWADCLKALPVSLADFLAAGHAGEYDVIVCNPPYYITGKSIIPAGAQRSAARRDADLTIDDVLQAAAVLLAPSGRLALILPTAREEDLLTACTRAGMRIVRRCLVATTPRKAPSRLLVEVAREVAVLPAKGNCAANIVVYSPSNWPGSIREAGQDGETYLTIGSEEFKTLTGDFYL